jgi:hypothetical protein
MDLGEIEFKGAEWNKLAQERVQWQAFVNLVMKFWFNKSREFLEQMDNCHVFKEDPAPAGTGYLLILYGIKKRRTDCFLSSLKNMRG